MGRRLCLGGKFTGWVEHCSGLFKSIASSPFSLFPRIKAASKTLVQDYRDVFVIVVMDRGINNFSSFWPHSPYKWELQEITTSIKNHRQMERMGCVTPIPRNRQNGWADWLSIWQSMSQSMAWRQCHHLGTEIEVSCSLTSVTSWLPSSEPLFSYSAAIHCQFVLLKVSVTTSSLARSHHPVWPPRLL